MAKSIPPFSWKNGFREPGKGTPWVVSSRYDIEENEEESHYTTPPSAEVFTSRVHNHFGFNVLRTWPTIYDGTSSPHGASDWWKPSSKVDVLICGAGPSGLQVALSLARQGISFRIIDKESAPLVAGRANGVQPRFLEILHSWGLASEVQEEGPLIDRTAIYKDGKRLIFSISHQSDSRYRGLHIITQAQIERIYIRDLLRHQKLVERQTVITGFEVREDASDGPDNHPVQAVLKNESTGHEEIVHAKYLVGSDGATSGIRKSLAIPFDGVSTDIYWGIMDCIFESDYPHAWIFGSVISSQHGGCVIMPREDGYIRLYTQLDASVNGELAKARQAESATFKETAGHVDVQTITADEVLAQANRIFAPYTIKFASPLSWFTVWKISERVARSFSSPDQRVHLVGDAAHVHSVMGGFGLNASILDSCNLAWKLGLCIRQLARPSVLLPTYDAERRLHANCIIRVSGSYLRFVCNSSFPLASFEHAATGLPAKLPGPVEYTPGEDLEFLRTFFTTNGPFLVGVDGPYGNSVISPTNRDNDKNTYDNDTGSNKQLGDNKSNHKKPPISCFNGVRAPNPRLCLSTTRTGYLYDVLTGASRIHLVIFASDLQGSVRKLLSSFSTSLSASSSFYSRYGGADRFHLVLVAKATPYEAERLLLAEELRNIRENCTLLYDDRAPDDDAHTWYEVDHAKGAVVVIRPDLWIGTSAYLGEAEKVLGEYFEQWLIPVGGE